MLAKYANKQQTGGYIFNKTVFYLQLLNRSAFRYRIKFWQGLRLQGMSFTLEGWEALCIDKKMCGFPCLDLILSGSI